MELKSVLKETKYIIEKGQIPTQHILGRFKALLSIADAQTQNGTYYSEELWDSTLQNEKIKDKLSKKLVLGEIDHPTDPETAIKRVSHAVLDLRKEGKEIWGTCEVFNTPSGQILWTLLNAGVILGMSSRALGEEEYTKEGVKRIKSEGFDLIGWDAVVDPSVVGAGFKGFTEGKKRSLIESFKKIKDPIMEQIVKQVEDQDLSILNKSIDGFKNEIINLKKSLDTQLNLVLNKDKFNKQMEVDLKNANNEIKRLESEINTKQMVIESKDKTIKSLDEELKGIDSKLKLFESEVNESKTLLEKKNREIKQLSETKKSTIYEVTIDPTKIPRNVGGKLEKESVISRTIANNMPKRI